MTWPKRLQEAYPPACSRYRKICGKTSARPWSSLSRLDLVTRQEFDIQSAVLARTREKLEHLEKQLAKMEKMLLK